jgi:hypothetical protein
MNRDAALAAVAFPVASAGGPASCNRLIEALN